MTTRRNSNLLGAAIAVPPAAMLAYIEISRRLSWGYRYSTAALCVASLTGAVFVAFIPAKPFVRVGRALGFAVAAAVVLFTIHCTTCAAGSAIASTSPTDVGA